MPGRDQLQGVKCLQIPTNQQTQELWALTEAVQHPGLPLAAWGVLPAAVSCTCWLAVTEKGFALSNTLCPFMVACKEVKWAKLFWIN